MCCGLAKRGEPHGHQRARGTARSVPGGGVRFWGGETDPPPSARNAVAWWAPGLVWRVPYAWGCICRCRGAAARPCGPPPAVLCPLQQGLRASATELGSVADAFSVVDDKDVEGIAVGVLGDVRFVMRVVDLVRFGRLCGERN